jgi:fucose permease
MPVPFLLPLIYAAFIALGLPDGLFGVAWPTMRAGFGVPIDAMGAAMVLSTTGYLSSSFMAAALVRRLGINRVLALSCALTAAALAAVCLSPSWPAVVACNLFLGLGAGGVDAGLNTYVAANYGERQMHWMHACYGIGATGGPLLMTLGLRYFGAWRPGYWAVAALQAALALLFTLTHAAWRGRAKKEKKPPAPAGFRETLSQASAWLGILTFFLYAGAELGLGFWAYSILTEARGVDKTAAGFLAGSFYGLFSVGRFLSGALEHKLPRGRLVPLCLGAALVGALFFWLDLAPWLSFAGMAFTGFAIAPVFPALVSATEARVGKAHAANAIGMQMAAAGAGSALLPGLLGVLARYTGVGHIPAALAALLGLVLLAVLSGAPTGTGGGRRKG